MSKPLFQQIKSGEVYQPKWTGFLEECCRCGLIHKVDYRLVKNVKGVAVRMRRPKNVGIQIRVVVISRAQARRIQKGKKK